MLNEITYSITGFGVVLATLAILWMVTVVIGQLVKAAGLDKVSPPKAKQAPATKIPAETIAVISAAVSFATGGKAAIKDIKKIG